MGRRPTVLAMILVLLMLGGGAAYLTMGSPQEPTEQRPRLWRIDTATVETLELRLAGVAPVQVQRDSAGNWQRKGGGPVDGDRMQGILLILSAPDAKRALPLDQSKLAAYGLAPPRGSLSLGMSQSGGSPSAGLSSALGAATPDGAGHYVWPNTGDASIFIVDASWVKALRHFAATAGR